MSEIDLENTNKKKKKKIRKKTFQQKNTTFGFPDYSNFESKSSITLSCTLLFSLSHLFCGIVIPLSDSFVTSHQREKGMSYYLEIFLLIQYSVAIFGIIYLQLYIYIYERNQKTKMQKTRQNDFELTNDNDKLELTDGLTNKECAKVTFDLSPNTCEDGCCTKISPPATHSESHLSTTASQHSILMQNSITSESSSTNSENVDNLAVTNDNEGINLYLRLGAVGFGFGVLVHDGFKIADQIRIQDIHCHNNLWTPKHCLHLVYIFIQTFFVFKYHKIIFTKQKWFLRFIICQLAVINICQWFKAVVFEINEELTTYPLALENDHFNHSHHDVSCSNQLSQNVSPYLFPCAIEYGLICAAILYKMLQKVGKTRKEKLLLQQFSSVRGKFSSCHRSHKGLFVGLLFFMATLVGLATFLAFKSKTSTHKLAVMVYQISEIVLLVSSIIALIFAFIKMRVLKYRQISGEEALDNNLILVGLSGGFAYNLFLFISTIDSSVKSSHNKEHITFVVIICKSITEIMQSLLQVLFILEGSRKCAGVEKHVSDKPGRSFLTFLIISNLALWIVSIFEARRAEEHLFFTNYYQKTPWSIIMHTSLPLIIFYRFHSTICLSDIWTKSYKTKIPY